eukprot:TRINITY_DN40801_c0_g1_i1.p1 TRINITY_DN40801_c0_g1~~TRINITY_DN40801_c0_g1_i1.p1  ORF type:complete len:108 (+),score=12.24 TRINITY_DN40801_c0_g1_i1:140-463(+)
MYCTMKAFKKLFPESPKWNLDIACATLSIPNQCRTSHGALIDALLAAKLLLKLEEEIEKRFPVSQSDIENVERKEEEKMWSEVHKSLIHQNQGFGITPYINLSLIHI